MLPSTLQYSGTGLAAGTTVSFSASFASALQSAAWAKEALSGKETTNAATAKTSTRPRRKIETRSSGKRKRFLGMQISMVPSHSSAASRADDPIWQLQLALT